MQQASYAVIGLVAIGGVAVRWSHNNNEFQHNLRRLNEIGERVCIQETLPATRGQRAELANALAEHLKWADSLNPTVRLAGPPTVHWDKLPQDDGKYIDRY